MKPAPSLDDYLRAPLGRFYMGETWAHFWAAPDLVGFLLFGRPTASEMRRLTTCFELEIQPRAQKLFSICDSRRMESVDREAYDTVQRFVEVHHAELARAID